MTQALEQRIEALEATVAALDAKLAQQAVLAKGEKGDPGKDGRDGRDGKSTNPTRMLAAIKSMVGGPAPAPSVSFDPRITILPADVQFKAPDVHVAAPQVHVNAPDVHVAAPTIHVEHARAGRTVTRHKRDEFGEIIESVAEHIGEANG